MFWSKQMPDIGRNATSAKEVLEERPSLSQTAMLVRRRLVFSYTVCRSVIQLYHNHNAMKQIVCLRADIKNKISHQEINK